MTFWKIEVYYSPVTNRSEHICSKFFPKVLYSKKPEDLPIWNASHASSKVFAFKISSCYLYRMTNAGANMYHVPIFRKDLSIPLNWKSMMSQMRISNSDGK